ncbi:hypothetical protein Tco_0162952 [Tanacetum coccineum]
MHTRGCEVLGGGDHSGGLSRFGGQGFNGEGLHGGSGDGDVKILPLKMIRLDTAEWKSNDCKPLMDTAPLN